MQQPCKRLKFENFLHSSPVTVFASTSIAWLTDYSKVAKITGRHKIFSIGFSGADDCWETYPLALTDTIFHKWNAPEVSSPGCEVARSTTLSYSTSQGPSPCLSSALLRMVSWYWLFFVSSFLESTIPQKCAIPVMVMVNMLQPLLSILPLGPKTPWGFSPGLG